VAKVGRLWIQRVRANLDSALQIRTNNRNKFCADVWVNGRKVYRMVVVGLRDTA